MRETGVKYEVVLRFKYYLSEKVPRSQKLTLLQGESFSHNVNSSLFEQLLSYYHINLSSAFNIMAFVSAYTRP